MQKRRHEIDIHKDMLRAQIKSSEEERQTVRYSSGGRTGEGTWEPVSLGGYSGVWGKVFLSNIRQPGGEPFSILNSRCPRLSKGFLWWVLMCKCVTRSLWVDRHRLFISDPNSLPDIVRCCRRASELCMHSRILVREPCLILQKVHFRLSWVPQKHLCVSSLFTGFYDLAYERKPGERS